LNRKFQQLILNVKDKLGLYSSISLGIFLFILFFQPFPNKYADLNTVLIFNAGFGAIAFVLLIIIRIVSPWLFQDQDLIRQDENPITYFNGFSILVLSSVAFAFYLKYVGETGITFYIMFKIVLICFIIPISLMFYRVRNESRQEIKLLVKENISLKRQLDKIEENDRNKMIEFISENITENLKLPLSSVVLIKSADNYVEIFYREENTPKKRLIRNTLKKIEQQLRAYPAFLRCHRTSIINIQYLEKLDRKINNYWIILKDFDERIPVSRQYILKLKETLALR
jgi:hypothetical protein